VNSMKRLWFIVLAAVAFFCLSGNTTLIYGSPKMALPEQVFNFQEVIEGRVLEHEFVIYNKGDQPLEIQQVKTG